MQIRGLALALIIGFSLQGLAACREEAPDAADIAAEAAAARAEMEAATDAALAAAEASHGSGEPALWVLKDDDTTLYIMGTVHLLRPELEWRSDAINAAVNAADTLVFEADVSSPEASAEMMKFVRDEGLFADGGQLTNLLSDSEELELKAALDYVGLPLGAVQNMRPWFAAVNLSVMQMTKDGFDPTAGVEQVLMAEGAAQGKSFAYLETVDDQLGRLAGLPDDVQVDFLISSAESIEDGAEMLDTLVGEWIDGDVNGLSVLLANPEMMGSEEVYDALLRTRNEAWAPQIAAMLDTPGTRLIAVGSGHLAGEDSVITLLRGRGLEVMGP
ncbi:MAG: TraB/GumN family protein [Hyphomonas sp.]|uniref:TraB/GumN family protein n=1 Tax=Hyphomonas sp. TaxID=87 RepID=UPI003002B56D